MSTTVSSAVSQAVQRLHDAASTQIPCAPVRDLIGSNDIATAYAVQDQLTHARYGRGARLVGWKIGLTSPAVQHQLGVDRPDFGVLFDDMAYTDGGQIPMSRLMQPKVEAEIAFVLNSDLTDPAHADGTFAKEQVRDAIDHAVPALEIVDSRIAGWDISFGDTVADNASSGLYVLGSRQRGLDSFEPAGVTMSMRMDGAEVSTGNGAACMGDPLEAVAWLAGTVSGMGERLRAGHVILSGALGPMQPVHAGARVSAEISTLGTISTMFQE